MSQIRRRMAETTNYEHHPPHKPPILPISPPPLHLSRILYKSATFYAKQTQFPKAQNERKYLLYKGI